MFVKNILFTLIFLPCISFSQTMFEVDYAYQADSSYLHILEIM